MKCVRGRRTGARRCRSTRAERRGFHGPRARTARPTAPRARARSAHGRGRSPPGLRPLPDDLLDEALTREAIAGAGVGLWVYLPLIDEIRWSEPLARLFGLTPERAPRTYAEWRELIHPDDLTRVEAIVGEALDHGAYPDLEHRILRPDGSVRHILVKGHIHRGRDGAVARITGVVIDVTERRVLESRVREDMRLESLSRLAGGIAHDFNNMLTVILGSANLALELGGPLGPLADNLLAIRDAAERSAALTSQLLAFARRHPTMPRRTDLGELVRVAEGLARHLLGPDIDLALELNPVPSIQVDPSQLQQALMNLVANARDAMPSGGRLVLRVGPARLGLGGHGEEDEAPTHVRLEVEDDGHGIAPEILPRIFEPFFSTRAPHQSTGLGLSMVHGIVRQHDGRIAVDSEPGRGTRVSIDLPVAPEPATTHRPISADEAALILLAEDEPRVRAVTASILRALGHEVVEASDGLEALAHASVRVPDLLVTDVVMPRLGGFGLVRALRSKQPELAVILMSGLSGRDEPEGVPSDLGAVAWVSKPFPPDVLASQVRAVLGAGPGARAGGPGDHVHGP